ncbi:MAG: hypothetical protein JRI64_09520 [Deltaproteobacteria bacterium]|nr:hypothetical protein [Deltaproteobacteria bacterium]
MNDLVSDQPTSKTSALIDLIPIGSIDQLAVSIVAANLQTILGLNSFPENHTGLCSNSG